MRIQQIPREGIHAEFERGPGVVGEGGVEEGGFGGIEASGFEEGEEGEEVVEVECGALDVHGDFAGADQEGGGGFFYWCLWWGFERRGLGGW